MQALVTGAAGCVGSALAELLKARGHEVRALVREGSDTAFLKTLDVELTRGDLGDRPSLDAAVRGVDAVFHCAALVGDWVSLDEMRRVNVEGLGRLLEASAAEGVRFSGSDDCAAWISASGMPVRCATLITATRRSTSRG